MRDELQNAGAHTQSESGIAVCGTDDLREELGRDLIDGDIRGPECAGDVVPGFGIELIPGGFRGGHRHWAKRGDGGSILRQCMTWDLGKAGRGEPGDTRCLEQRTSRIDAGDEASERIELLVLHGLSSC